MFLRWPGGYFSVEIADGLAEIGEHEHKEVEDDICLQDNKCSLDTTFTTKMKSYYYTGNCIGGNDVMQCMI